jgi:hypothetical protein
MQAPGSLNHSQRYALTSTYTFLQGVTEYLESVLPIVCAEDELHVGNLLTLGKLCLAELVRNFPDVAEWEKLGGVR